MTDSSCRLVPGREPSLAKVGVAKASLGLVRNWPQVVQSSSSLNLSPPNIVAASRYTFELEDNPPAAVANEK